jgi:hypothetical protein
MTAMAADTDPVAQPTSALNGKGAAAGSTYSSTYSEIARASACDRPTVRSNGRRIDPMKLSSVDRQRAVLVARGGNLAALNVARQGRLGLADRSRRLSHGVQHQGCESFE